MNSGLAEASAGGPPNGLDQDLSFKTIFFLASLMGISLWNASEVILVTYLTYRRLRTLYFWSIMASATGVIVCTISQIINSWVTSTSNLLPAVMGSVGWVPMVTGQSLVLYSRLHLLYIDHRILRLVLAMIIIDAITLHGTNIVLAIGASSSSPEPFTWRYIIAEKVEVTIFFVQEALLSGIYLWYARTFVRRHSHHLEDTQDKNVRAVKRTLRSLVVTNIVILLLDLSVLVLQFLGLYIPQLNSKNFVYSVKLKLEIGVLNQLKDFVKRTRTFDSSPTREREDQRQRRARQEEHIEVQWEAALRRAFGSISRSLARTKVGEAVDARARDAQDLDASGGSSKSRARRSAERRSQQEFFNVELLLATNNERTDTPTVLEVVVDREDCFSSKS